MLKKIYDLAQVTFYAAAAFLLTAVGCYLMILVFLSIPLGM